VFHVEPLSHAYVPIADDALSLSSIVFHVKHPSIGREGGVLLFDRSSSLLCKIEVHATESDSPDGTPGRSGNARHTGVAVWRRFRNHRTFHVEQALSFGAGCFTWNARDRLGETL
jgi:hypothetical protein